MAYTSGMTGGYLFADRLYPSIEIFSWDIDEQASPIGMRDIYGGSFAFKQRIGLGASEPLEFENVLIDHSAGPLSGNYQSKVACITFRQTNDRFNLSNLKFYMPSGGIIDTSGHLEFAVSGIWIYNATMPSGTGGAISSTLPTLLNIRRSDGLGYIDGSADIHSTEFIYLCLTVPSGLPLGRYGINGSSGDIAFKLTYDYFQII